MLNSKQRAKLKSIASTEDTILQVGKNGVIDTLVVQVNDALKARELIKMKVQENCMLSPAEAANELAEKTKQRGNEWGLEPLTKAQSELDDLLSGHTIASVACAISEEKLCYYRCPYSGGAAFVAVRGVDETVFSGADIAAFAEITMKCISEFDLDHRIFAESFLLRNRTSYEWDANVLIAHFDRDLYIEFENKKGVLRVASIKTK